MVARVCASTRVPGADVSFFFFCLGASLFFRDFDVLSSGVADRGVFGEIISFFVVFRTSC